MRQRDVNSFKILFSVATVLFLNLISALIVAVKFCNVNDYN